MLEVASLKSWFVPKKMRTKQGCPTDQTRFATPSKYHESYGKTICITK